MAESRSESVLVVPTEVFRKVGYFQGFSGEPDRYVRELLRPENLSFRPRDAVEDDPGFKQLIPYIVLRWVSPTGQEFVFEYARAAQQTEARLRAKRSIGIGGHISESDVLQGTGAAGMYERGMQREIAEEVDIRSAYTARCVGLINDDANDVGRVHLGIVHLFDLERPAVSAIDCDLCDGGFKSTSELLARESEFESWSQICLKSLFSHKGLHEGRGG